jgi:glucosamine--fructose-6-phosphate aminotransferase (isomerizing)
MCGIVGYIGHRDGVQIAIEGLRRLEYRGYDSAGIAVLGRSGIRSVKKQGKVRALTDALPKRLRGAPCIAHTRWATHGAPSDLNAHPHTSADGRVAIVHNGIVENARPLRARIVAAGVEPVSETDSELLAHLVALHLDAGPGEAVRRALAEVTGTWGLVVLFADHPDTLVVARNGSPVILGLGEHEMYVASDLAALVRHTRQVVHLDDGEIATLTADGFRTTTLDARPTEKTPLAVDLDTVETELGSHRHWMLKEIEEQPEACRRTLGGRLEERFATAHLGGLNLSPRELLEFQRVKILGCGSAYYAGLFGAGLIEQLARLPANAEAASEFRYRNPVIEKSTLYIVVSQSGETLDTLMAAQEVRRKGGRLLGIVNVVGSTLAREVDGGIYIHAGPEVSVASTKTWVSTGVAFALLALHIGRIRDLGHGEGQRLMRGLLALPERLRDTLALDAAVGAIAARHIATRNAFFIGRAAGYAVALEGAQKLKEISYVHAEAYPAAELKHGPLALVDAATPSVVVLPAGPLHEKMLSSVAEIRARGGPVIAVTHQGCESTLDGIEDVIAVPRSEPELDPLLMVVPLQLLAYRLALALGRDIDQPRNLAKSVTVE